MSIDMKKIIILIIVVAIAVFVFVRFSGKENQNMRDTEKMVVGDVVPGEIREVDKDTNTFIHKGYGFSLNFPSDMTVSNFREGDGEQILFQSNKASPAGEWFQIYITPWDEAEDISVERIKQDLPDILIADPQRVVIGPRQKEGVGPVALIFFSYDSGLGDTREAWFVYPEPNRGVASYLYQITTYKRLDTMIGIVLSTLSFD
jgi:hypothetical protein